MKIAIINNLYPPFDRGGAEKIAQQEVSALKNQGHQVFVVTSKDQRQSIPDQSTEKVYYLNSLYSRLNRLPVLFRLIWHFSQFFKPLARSKIIKIIKQEKPDLVISHNLMGLGWRLAIILKKLNIDHHHYLHDIQLLHPAGLMFWQKEKIIKQPLAKFYQLLTRPLFKHCLKVISPSWWLLELHQERGFFKKANTQVKTIDKTNYPKIVWPENIKKLVFIGQLEEHKGISFLLAWLKNNHSQSLSLSVIGDGSFKKTLEKIGQNNPQLNYLGKLKKEAILKELKEHDCLIVPSLCYENSPTVIFEAAQVGTPIIASALGGILELKSVFNLRLFTPGDQKSLNKALFLN